MKKTIWMVGAIVLCSSSVFGQKVTQIPQFSNEAEKSAWIQAHPADYERMSGEKVTPATENAVGKTAPEFRTKEEKDAWVNNQKAIPEFKTQEEKDAYFTKGKVVEPVKVDFTTEAAKNAWLEEHPNTTIVTEQEFNALPAEKQATMLSDKNYVIIK
jgi:hypothetical protein